MRDQGRHNARALNHWGRQKVSKMSQGLSSMQQICLRKTLGSNMGGPNLLLAPGAFKLGTPPLESNG